MQTNQQKQTKTYGLVGFDAPFRQGRSLSLPTLPFQKTNRYAVVGATSLTYIYICRYKFVVISNSYIISKIGMRLVYVLGQVRMQVEAIIHVFGIRFHTF